MEFFTQKVTKSTGFYQCPDDIANLKIRIKVEEGPPTPKPVRSKIRHIKKDFSWQEKHLSKTQKEYYRDERNCLTDREKEYHEFICDSSDENDQDILFSYVSEENFCPESEVTNSINYIEQELNKLNIKCSLKNSEYNFHENLINAVENPLCKNNTENMYLMADFGEYFEDSWIKNEKLLCTLKYDADSKVLQIFPDFTTSHPYSLKIQNDDERVFNYFIENCSSNMPESIEANEKTLIKKLSEYQHSIKNQLIPEIFKLPPKNKLYVFLFGEITYGQKFEYPEVYVKYSTSLPDGWTCPNNETLKGRTHISRAINKNGLVHFGHCFDIVLEYSFTNLEHTEFPNSPYIYFEVISKDSWDRYRTEGLCYINLPLSQSGNFEYNLNCFRFTTASPITEMKRFFIGDCQNYEDISWIGIPTEQEDTSLNKYGTETIGTGELNFRLSIMHQSQEFLDDKATSLERNRRMIFEKLGLSTLIKSVEQVIQEFKKARKEMLEARKNI